MLTAVQCQKKFGTPGTKTEGNYMVIWDVPSELELGVIPKKLYCNKLMVDPLTKAFKNIITRKLVDQLKTWDGCYQIRLKRGQQTMSLHSWGCAVDINAAWNQFGKKPTMSKELVACFTDAGLDWGGVWSKPDGMHFQLKTV